MAAQDNLIEFFSFNTTNDVSNVSFQRDCPRRGAVPCVKRRIQGMSDGGCRLSIRENRGTPAEEGKA